jgi:ribosomal protein S19
MASLLKRVRSSTTISSEGGDRGQQEADQDPVAPLMVLPEMVGFTSPCITAKPHPVLVNENMVGHSLANSL